MTWGMQRVSSLVSKDIGDYLTNQKTWGNVMYNVLERGLIGDGTTNDTAALQTLINTAIAAGRKAIFFPHTDTGGQYFVTALTNADQVVFFGDNASFVGGHTGTINQLGDNYATLEIDESTLYVDVVNGNDANAGTQANPFKTITKAISEMKKNFYFFEKVIRVLPGDYTAEGEIEIQFFSGGRLTITAFNGTTDVTAVSDNYKMFKFICYNNDCFLTLQGFRSMNSDTNTYGIFIERCMYVYVSAHKDIENTAVNSAIGITRNSSVMIENCLAANKSAVVSSNFASRVVSLNWDAASINNTQGLVANNGGIFHKSGTQPVATVSTETILNGGTLFDVLGNPTGQKTYYQNLFTRDLTVAGNYSITIDLAGPPRWIQISAAVQSTEMAVQSNHAGSNNSCIFTTSTGIKAGSFAFMEINDGAGNNVVYNVVSLSATEILLSRTIAGAGVAGTLQISLLCGV